MVLIAIEHGGLPNINSTGDSYVYYSQYVNSIYIGAVEGFP